MQRNAFNIYRRKDGRWEGRYKSGFKVDGKSRYTSVYGKSYSAVREILEKKQAEYIKGCVCNCNYTVGQIADFWVSDVKNKVKESTLANYNMKLNKHILPHFSGIKYDKLTAEKLNEFINIKLGENLSEKYVADIVVIIKSVARFANRRYGYINRIECVTSPKSHKREDKRLLTPDEQDRLVAAVKGNPDCSNVGILLTFSTGLRIGELCALKWADVDLEKSILTVNQTVQRIAKKDGGTRLLVGSPKSSSSIRTIPLPAFIIPYLKAIKAADDCYLLSGNTKLVEPRTMQYRFKSLLKRLELPYVSFHSLRHTFATNCVAMNFDIKTLSEILGHSSVEVTLNRYVHSSMDRKKSCMQIFSERFSA